MVPSWFQQNIVKKQKAVVRNVDGSFHIYDEEIGHDVFRFHV